MAARVLRVIFMLASAVILPLSAASAQQPPPPCQTGCVPYHVTVTPQGAVIGRYLSSSHDTTVFTVTNDGQEFDHYTLSCSATGGVTCTSVSSTSLRLGNGTNALDTVVYSLGSSPGTISLAAVGSNGTPPASSTGYDTVSTQPTVTIQVPVASAGRAVVHNRQPILRAIFATNGSPLDTTKTLLIWRSDTVTLFHSDTLSTARVNRGLVEWEVDSIRELGLPDSAQMTVKACAQNGLCTTASEWVVLLGDHKPVLDFTTLPLETPGAAFSAPFGPGLGVTGADVTTGFSIPAYTSSGASHSAGLVYSTRTSYPRALVPINVELPWPNGTATKLCMLRF
jgi:hypothetical protein